MEEDQDVFTLTVEVGELVPADQETAEAAYEGWALVEVEPVPVNQFEFQLADPVFEEVAAPVSMPAWLAAFYGGYKITISGDNGNMAEYWDYIHTVAYREKVYPFEIPEGIAPQDIFDFV